MLDLKKNILIPCKQKNFKKDTKGIGLLQKLKPILLWTSILNIYKLFIRPHLDCGDVVYDQPSNDTFSNELETLQYNSALAITGTIKAALRKQL